MALIEQESADALRYWATSIKTGSDTTFNPEMIATGRRLVTKLWNACRFAESRLQDVATTTITSGTPPATLLPTDRWLLSRLARTIATATSELLDNEYAAARSEVEHFFWSDLCDNYLELVKARLYRDDEPAREAAQWVLYQALLSVLKLLAPYLPYVTEEIYQQMFRAWEGAASIHVAAWPAEQPAWIDPAAEETGKALLELLRQVRRYKAERGLSVGAELDTLRIQAQLALHAALQETLIDLRSATRARDIVLELQASGISGEASITLDVSGMTLRL